MTDKNGAAEPADTRDDLRSQLEAAFKGGDAPSEPAQEPAPVVAGDDDPIAEEAAAQAKAERARDEKGRFAPSDTKEPALAKPEQSAESKADASANAPAPTTDKGERIAPPPHWNGAGKIKWERLPRDVQAHIASDYKQLTDYTQAIQGVAKVLEPRAQLLAATYGTVESGLDQLFKLSDFASKQPAEFVQWFLQQRGIDPASLAQQPQGQPTGQPADNALKQEVAELKRQLQAFQGQQRQAEASSIEAHISQFMHDPAHPYFNDVRQDMGALLDAGRAKNLQEAYDMAVWANPQTRAQLMASEREKEEAERKALAAKAQRAASATVTGSPAFGISPDGAPPDSVRGALIAAMQEHGGRV